MVAQMAGAARYGDTKTERGREWPKRLKFQ